MNKVFFVGPLPPPIHGFSVINQAMLQSLQARSSNIFISNVAPKGLVSAISTWLRFCFSAVFNCFKSECVLYLSLSGGIRQLIDFLYIFLAIVLRFRVFFHHHSFAYLNEPRWVTKFIFACVPHAKHIVLGASMGEVLSVQYNIPHDRIVVLSNAAFMSLDEAKVENEIQRDELVIGFLSNITVEKGIFLFFDLVEKLNADGQVFKALIAGPLSGEVEDAFKNRLASFKNIDYIGPVYNADKAAFYSRLDALVFPTIYKNEAEPVTIWEAFASHVPVFALKRGCIKDIVPINTGHVTDNIEQLYGHLVAFIKAGNHPLNKINYRSASRAHFENASNHAKDTLRALVIEMTG